MGACIRAHIERGKGLAPFAPVSGGAQIGDLVHAEVADLGKGAVVADEVVVLVVPEQGIGAHVVPRAAAAQNAPAVPVVSRVVEPDALVAVDGGVQLVHQIIYGFVHRLDAVFDDDLPPQLLGLMHAGQPFKLCDQLQRLFARNEPRGLHAVGQQPQLRQLEHPLADVPAGDVPVADTDQIQSEGLQGLQIAVNALALGADALRGEILQELRCGDRVCFVGIALEILPEKQQLELLIGRACHGGLLPKVLLWKMFLTGTGSF